MRFYSTTTGLFPTSHTPHHPTPPPPCFFSPFVEKIPGDRICPSLKYVQHKRAATAPVSSWVSGRIYGNPLRQIPHPDPPPLRFAPPTPMKSATRADGGAFMQIHTPPRKPKREASVNRVNGWPLTPSATEREAGGLIWGGVWQAGEHSWGCIRLTLPQTSSIY